MTPDDSLRALPAGLCVALVNDSGYSDPVRVFLWAITIVAVMLGASACGGAGDDSAQSPPRDDGPRSGVEAPEAPELPEVEAPEAPEPPDPEVPEAPEVRPFEPPDAPVVEAPEVTSPDVTVRKGEEGTVYVLEADVLFDFDRSDIRPDAEAALREVSDSIASRAPDGDIAVYGHTDSVGDDGYNQRLSEERAASVANRLVANDGLDRDRVSASGAGEQDPVASNTNADGSDNPAGRQQNRRVEIFVTAG